MPTTHTAAPDPRFPVDTELSIYAGEHRSLVPGGSAVTTATVASNRTWTATGLAYDTRYTAGATVNGRWLTTLFTTETDPDLDPALMGEARRRIIQVDRMLYGPNPPGLAVASGIASYAFPTGAASASTMTLLAGNTAEVVHAYWTLLFTPNANDNRVELLSFSTLTGSSPNDYAQMAESDVSASATPIPQFFDVTEDVQALAEYAAQGIITESAYNRGIGFRVKTGASGMTIAESMLSIRYLV